MIRDDLNNRKLLVVDDEPDITKTLFRQFRRKYKVFTALSGSEAIKKMEEENIQVVISDQRMPGMTGVDFFRVIKDKFPDTLKLILTGYSDIEAVISAINEGQVFRYLHKPWNPVELEMAINEAFDKFDLVSQNKRLIRKLHDANINLEKRVKDRTLDLEKVNEKLKKLNIEKNKTIGVVAHDLRSPITTAFSFSDFLISDYKSLSADEHITYLKQVNERCEYSLNLINSLLDESKIEAGVLDLNFQKINWIDLVEKVISLQQLFATPKKQLIHLETANKNLQVLVDPDKMEQVISNLLSNAIKYSPENSKITVAILKKNEKLETAIIDQGIGIHINEIDSVFDDYKTSSNKATGGEKSTGLGLSIAKKITNAHHGIIELKSEQNKGSTFKIILPID